MVQCRKIPTGKVNIRGDETQMNDKFFDLKQEKQDRMINAALKIFSRKGDVYKRQVLLLKLMRTGEKNDIQEDIFSI